MSRIYGPVRQLGYVVRDIEAAMAHWTETLGVGPFFLFPRVGVRDVIYRGAPSDAALSIALANDGEMQIELIEQLNDAPSLYRDHLDAYGEVLHHTSAWTTDFDAELARIEAAGGRVIQSGAIGRNRFAYFDTHGDYPSTTMELYDVSGGAGRLNERVREAARGWDGADPVRRLG
ncbi:MAG: VOC family protein [Pseudomonadota bacterium]|nr:VOC family protein [Pseudomonadota bacterium]MEE3099743.1 VOC family protein [Pseudomonadota bacterium]